MVRGLEEELNARMSGELGGPFGFTAATLDSNYMPLEMEENTDDLFNPSESNSRSTVGRMGWVRKLLNQT
jgi:hypothetical protein